MFRLWGKHPKEHTYEVGEEISRSTTRIIGNLHALKRIEQKKDFIGTLVVNPTYKDGDEGFYITHNQTGNAKPFPFLVLYIHDNNYPALFYESILHAVMDGWRAV